MDPSGWKVPVLVSNFGQETIMVEPFSEIGMIAQVSAIQPVMCQPSRPGCDPSMSNIYEDFWTGHLTTWTTLREASWRIHCCSSWTCSPCRALR